MDTPPPWEDSPERIFNDLAAARHQDRWFPRIIAVLLMVLVIYLGFAYFVQGWP